MAQSWQQQNQTSYANRHKLGLQSQQLTGQSSHYNSSDPACPASVPAKLIGVRLSGIVCAQDSICICIFTVEHTTQQCRFTVTGSALHNFLAHHKLQKVRGAIACVTRMLQDYFNEEDDEDARRVPPRPSSPELHSEGVGRPFVKLRPGSPPSQRPPPRVSFLSHHLFSLHQSDIHVALHLFIIQITKPHAKLYAVLQHQNMLAGVVMIVLRHVYTCHA